LPACGRRWAGQPAADVYGGWPTINGSLGPMARTVTDLAKLLDGMVG